LHETTAMARKKLISEPLSYPDLGIIGISSQLKDYRLAYHINLSAALSLTRLDDLPVYQEKEGTLPEFPLFAYYECNRRLHFYLIGNSNHTAKLVPAYRQADYFLLTKGPFEPEHQAALIKTIRKIEGVQLTFPVEGTKVKNLEGIMTDLELHLVGKGV